jgi:hypothetical protein
MPSSILSQIAFFIVRKAKAQQAKVGTLQAAKNLRKQGYPLEMALAILAGR